jgi:eukaryotic-like serine/threonine-protein kinase
MDSKRPPWWMYVVAVSFAALHIFIPYIVIWGPSDLAGLESVFENGSMRVRAVESESMFGQTGFRVGDRVLSIDGKAVRSANDWRAVTANLEVGKPIHWELERAGNHVSARIVPVKATWENRLAHRYDIYMGLALGCFLVGLLIAFQRPGDPVARVGAWFIMTASVAFGLPNGWAPPWRQLPLPVQGLLLLPQISRYVIDGIFVSFVVTFPRRLFRARWPWLLIWIPVLATLPWRLEVLYSEIYRPLNPLPGPGWLFEAMSIRTVVYLAAGVALVVLGYRQLPDLDARRRARVLMAGTAVGLGAAIPIVWFFSFGGYSLAMSSLSRLAILLILACPASFAYAILRHRVFDIRVIIRQGLQYALARGAVLSAVPALGVLLSLDLVWNRDQTIATVLRSRGPTYFGLAALACLVYWRRKPWLESLDRRFFRERYDAQRLLREVAAEIRLEGTFERVAPRVLARIDAALHPEFVSVLVEDQNTSEFRNLVSLPAGLEPPPFRRNSRLLGVARALGSPLEVLLSDSQWLDRRLPHEELDVIRQSRLDLLVPISTAPDRMEAMLVLGTRKSEEPYSREDQELLETIATNLALALARQPSQDDIPTGTFEECPECGACYDTHSNSCKIDGSRLTAAHLPRFLTGRYRLERRVGRGGMGVVYEAMDESLGRKVAVKMIRDDLVGSADAAQRFQREARAAAAFAHPNVVTVHDFGILGGTRAFLVMELLEGVTLREELQKHKRVEARRLLEIFRGVCLAVDAAHRRQLIHRDLKPENIFLLRGGDSAGGAKVLDFGISKFIPALDETKTTRGATDTGAGVLIGTLPYISPEQLRGETPGTSWDLWAMTVVAYEALTGSNPFGPTARSGWQGAVLSGRFEPLDSHLASPPAAWQAFFERCFAVDQTARPHTAAEFLELLKQTLA